MQPPTEITFQLSADCPTHSRTHVRAGSHELVIDEPARLGGTDRGPTPIQTLLASLLSATNVLLHRIADARQISFDALKLGADATLDLRGVQLQSEIGVPLTKIQLMIDVTTSSSEAALEGVKSDLRKYCPVTKILRSAGTEVEEIWTVHAPTAGARPKVGAAEIT